MRWPCASDRTLPRGSRTARIRRGLCELAGKPRSRLHRGAALVGTFAELGATMRGRWKKRPRCAGGIIAIGLIAVGCQGPAPIPPLVVVGTKQQIGEAM